MCYLLKTHSTVKGQRSPYFTEGLPLLVIAKSEKHCTTITELVILCSVCTSATKSKAVILYNKYTPCSLLYYIATARSRKIISAATADQHICKMMP